MIRSLRAFFLARHLREKVMLVAFLLLGAGVWLSKLSVRAGRFLHDQRQTAVALADQTQWLNNRISIENSARQAASILDPARTLDATELLAAVNQIARDAGLKSTTSTGTQDVTSGQFAVHTLQFNVTKVSWDALKAFYLALQQRAPYIGIEKFQLQADRANRAALNANLQISSVEIIHAVP